MNKFTLTRLFATVTMIAVGLSAILCVLHSGQSEGPLLLIPLWFGGAALLGAGLFSPFDETLFGVIFALAIQFVLTAMLLSRLSGLGGG
jgi:hypothetical protein